MAWNIAYLPLPTTPPGVWVDVTPPGISLDPDFGGAGSNYGIETVQPDTGNPGHLYAHAHNQGIWKSTNYGITWNGPINTGTNGSSINGGGGIYVQANSTPGGAPTIFAAFIRGAVGLWRSTDGGVNWSSITLIPPLPSGRADVYAPISNPYDRDHLLMAGHEQDYLLQSFDNGLTWSTVTVPATPGAGTAFVYFIDTGNSTTTADTWLWISQDTGGATGTWRTTNGGTSWTQVDDNEHPHGACGIYQPDTSGVVYMAGIYSALGWGVLRSTDYGATWTHVGNAGNQTLVFGTATKVYSMYGWATTGAVNTSFQVADQPGTGTYTLSPAGSPGTINSGAHQVAVLNNGANNIFVASMGNGGLWRYIEAA